MVNNADKITIRKNFLTKDVVCFPRLVKLQILIKVTHNTRRICCRQGNSAVSAGTAADFYFAAEDN